MAEIGLYLKPCPFCGGKAHLSYAGVCKLIICGKCLVHTETYPTYEEAAEIWNRRAGTAAVPTTSKEEALELEYEGDGFDDNGEIIYDMAYCPICHQYYEVDYDNHDNYCRNCGQKLDWSRAEQEGI